MLNFVLKNRNLIKVVAIGTTITVSALLGNRGKKAWRNKQYLKSTAISLATTYGTASTLSLITRLSKLADDIAEHQERERIEAKIQQACINKQQRAASGTFNQPVNNFFMASPTNPYLQN